MPRQEAVNFEQSFSRGYITEATALTFPEDAATDMLNCVVTNEGKVRRRKGYDFENNHSTETIDRSNKFVQSYLWRNVDGSGLTNVVVTQVGDTLYFYRINESSVSADDVLDTLDLTTYQVSGADDISLDACSFTEGDGVLVCVHNSIDPIVITYDISADTVSAVKYTIKIRDLVGVDDSLDVDERPTATVGTLTTTHKYNLFNQGWYFNSNAALTAWDTARSDMPSNADIWWVYKDSSNAFDAAEIANYDLGQTPAPKGHYVVDAFNQDRDAASGLSGITDVTSDNTRPTVCATFAGRIWYAGVSHPDFNHHLYFTRVIEESDTDAYGNCYQKLDPTSEIASSLLPDDGGVINIPGVGTINKLWVLRGAIYVFSSEGVWRIGGTDNFGFSAVNYEVQKISSIGSLSKHSFVDIEGLPSWWNSTGIFSFSYDNNGSVQVIDLTIDTIKTYYDTIPTGGKRYAKGYYNPDSKVAQWLFRTTTSITPTDTVEYEYILNYNVRRNTFYVWSISESPVKIHDLFSIPASEGIFNLFNVIDSSSDTVVDSGSDQVITFRFQNTSSNISENFKYLCSYADGSGSYNFTFAENNSTRYRDFYTYDTLGTRYSSYFVTGYHIPGEGQRYFQTNYVHIFLEQESDASCLARAVFDWTNSVDSNKWSSQQQIYNSSLTNRDVNHRRLKFRGKGKSIQLRFDSVDDDPFTIIGWAIYETGNARL